MITKLCQLGRMLLLKLTYFQKVNITNTKLNAYGAKTGLKTGVILMVQTGLNGTGYTLTKRVNGQVSGTMILNKR